jgi:TldD protein
MISRVKNGIFAKSFSGGQVDVTSGKFVFSVSEAYLIENGKISAPVKGAMLIGDGPSILKKISMVGDDFSLDNGIGTCGKEGQWVPVGVGEPSVLIDKLTVGGANL